MKVYPFARSSVARDFAVLAALVVTQLLPAQALAQAVPNVLGLYRGFSQSDLDPRLHPMMELTVDRQRGSDFSGTLLMGAPGGQLPFTFQGKADALGGFKGKGTGPAGVVQFTGNIQGLGEGGALVLASYKFTFPGGTEDKGGTRLLRSFHPPDPIVPVITGTWHGTAMSDLTGQAMGFVLNITSQSADGTSFQGTAEVSGIVPCTIVGTIGPGAVSGVDPQPFRFVYIGVSDVGHVFVGGQVLPIPNDGLTARFFRNFATGAVDLGTFMVTPLR
jgi:hypothetical protein